MRRQLYLAACRVFKLSHGRPNGVLDRDRYQSEPPVPCGVQTAARVKPSHSGGGGRCRREAAAERTGTRAPATNLTSPHGCGANERVLDPTATALNHLGAHGSFGVAPLVLGKENLVTSS